MSISFKLRGFDQLFENTHTDKLIVNEHDGSDIEVKDYIDSLLMNNITTEKLSLIPTCLCGELRGHYYVGNRCPNEDCNTIVKSPIEEQLTYLVWIRQPKNVGKLISPFFLHNLLTRYRITSPAVNLVEYIMVSNFQVKGRNMRNYDKIEKLDYLLKNNDIPRGYNSFVDNYEKIIEILEMNFARTGTIKDKKEFIDWAISKKDQVFSGYIPVVNKSLFVLDTGNKGTFIDRSMLTMLSGVRRMTGIDLYQHSPANVQNKTARFLCEFARFYNSYFKDMIFQKSGLIRKHVTRARSHFTIRAVVSSLTTPHQPEDLLLPWSAATGIFREHILAALLARGYTYKASLDHLMLHIEKYSPLLDEIFKEILADKVAHGEVVPGEVTSTSRNPIIRRASFQFTRPVAVKTDPDDKTVSISYLLSPGFNMDFDGDMLHFTLMNTDKLRRGLERFKLHNSILSLNSPNEFSDVLAIPASISTNVSNWLFNEFE